MTPTPLSSSASVDALLARLTLEEKIGQVMIVGFDEYTLDAGLREMIATYHIGGVILFARNVASPQQVACLTNDLQQVASASGSLPLLISIDQEGGRVARLTTESGFTEFPGAMAVAASGNIENARRIGVAMAEELKAVGLNTNFAPSLDVNNNPANPVIDIRSFGSDPQRVGQWGVAYLEGLQSQGVLAFGKHFPGHGDTSVDSHVSLPVVRHDRQRLESVEFVPFQAAMRAGVAGIMSGHLTFPAIDPTPGLAATLSSKVLTDLLRGEMGYDGLLVTDSLEMGALAQSGYPVPLAAATALQAGADLLLFNRDHILQKAAFQQILEWVQSGKIPLERLDAAVRRVLAAKLRYGVLASQPVDIAAVAGQVRTAAHLELALTVSVQGITLLRDDAHLLPLTTDGRPLIVEAPIAAGLGRALNSDLILVDTNPTRTQKDAVLSMARGKRQVVVIVFDVAHNPGQVELVETLLAAGNPVVVVAVRSPYDLLKFPGAPTLLATYGWNDPAREALTAVLEGRARPQGHLPVELPGLYPLGWGISR